jgi:lipoprotein Spr
LARAFFSNYTLCQEPNWHKSQYFCGVKKLLSFLFFTCVALNLLAEESDSSTTIESQIDTAAALAFFEANGISMDSCTNKQLYFEVYNWIGTPYHYAGKSKRGIDCSGFSCKIYEGVFGTSLLGSSRSIYKTTKPVKLANAQEGDLVFFKIKKNKISHIGIYLQNGKFAHASSSRGVMISDLSESYYKRAFYKVGRLQAAPTLFYFTN